MKHSSYTTHPGLKPSPKNCPKHIAVIMDGNGRWAKSRLLSRTKGHRKGVEVARDIIFACQDKEIKVLTLFAFGMENWKRPTKEIRNIFRIFFLVLRKDIMRLHEKNIQVRVIGDRTRFNAALKKAIDDAESLTKNNTGLVLNIAVNYSGRWDLLKAMQQVARKVQEAQYRIEDIDEAVFSQELSLHDLPEPDLFIRTGGVQRISNFILWELAYTELFFTASLWPDFSVLELENALTNYAQRERRFGLTGDQL